MSLETLFGVGVIIPNDVVNSVSVAGETPFYLYDEKLIVSKCREIKEMPNAFGLFPRFAMKANSTKAILQIIYNQGFGIDASSINEVERANLAGIPYEKIMLTTQEVPEQDERSKLEFMISKGLVYNVCSLRQLSLISDFVSKRKIPVSIRIHPGTGGSGESITRNTANPYSCFGVHISELENALSIAKEKGVIIDGIHEHIGSGGSPEKWRESIDAFLTIVNSYLNYFPELKKINFGGGLKLGRMPDETSANPADLGAYAKNRLEEFYQKTRKKLAMEVEPGTYILAMSGNLVTRVIDTKSTGKDGFNFIVTNGGMEVNSRPLLYGSKHPFAIVSKDGIFLFSDFDLKNISEDSLFVPVGRCCESGDSQSLDPSGNIIPRRMAEPNIGDFFIVGGCGAYCSTMTPFNYNSHTQAPEVLKMFDETLKLIRKPQSLKDLIAREI